MDDGKKEQVRRQVRQALRAWPPEQRERENAGLRKLIRSLLASLADGTCVAAFIPLPGEPAILPELMNEALRLRLAFPRCGADGLYELALVRSAQDLRPGSYSIPEPLPQLPALPPDLVQLWLVPGLAFDRSGVRLGRGGGFYDRLLAGTHAPRCGLAFSVQILPSAPAQAHDVRMSWVLTSDSTLPFNLNPADPP